MNEALLIIDIQNDYFPGGANPLVGAEAAAKQAASALDAFRAAGKHVVHIQHISTRPGSTFFLPGTSGAEIHDLVKPLEGEAIYEKNVPNSFSGTGLERFLKEKGTTDLAICGMMTHMCVDATVRAARDLGYKCRVISDACATKDLTYNGQTVPAPFVQVAFLASLNGFYAQLITAEQIGV